jgi:hypothetical protein
MNAVKHVDGTQGFQILDRTQYRVPSASAATWREKCASNYYVLLNPSRIIILPYVHMESNQRRDSKSLLVVFSAVDLNSAVDYFIHKFSPTTLYTAEKDEFQYILIQRDYKRFSFKKFAYFQFQGIIPNDV